jgi:hypothetical protein
VYGDTDSMFVLLQVGAGWHGGGVVGGADWLMLHQLLHGVM